MKHSASSSIFPELFPVATLITLRTCSFVRVTPIVSVTVLLRRPYSIMSPAGSSPSPYRYAFAIKYFGLYQSKFKLLICPRTVQEKIKNVEVRSIFIFIAANVSICVRAGLPKPRLVPDTERNKDTKTLDYASTPLDANTLLCVVAATRSSMSTMPRD